MADAVYTRCFPEQPKDPRRVSYIDQTIVPLATIIVIFLLDVQKGTSTLPCAYI